MYESLTLFPNPAYLYRLSFQGHERFEAPCLDLQVPRSTRDNGTRRMVARGVIVIDSSHRSRLHR